MQDSPLSCLEICPTHRNTQNPASPPTGQLVSEIKTSELEYSVSSSTYQWARTSPRVQPSSSAVGIRPRMIGPQPFSLVGGHQFWDPCTLHPETPGPGGPELAPELFCSQLYLLLGAYQLQDSIPQPETLGLSSAHNVLVVFLGIKTYPPLGQHQHQDT